MFVYLQQFYHHRIIIYHNLTENIIYLSWQDVWKTISCWSKNHIFVNMCEEPDASYSRNVSCPHQIRYHEHDECYFRNASYAPN